MIQRREFGHWLVEFTPEDGGRLDRIAFDKYDFLTARPVSFVPPEKDFGEYENRPVYGYDDCFPTVEPCRDPVLQRNIPDHGELCWLKWGFRENSNSLLFSTSIKELAVTFIREMVFEESRLTWRFEVDNSGETGIHFQHVMHPLVRLDQVTNVKLPGFGSVFNETTGRGLGLKTPEALETYLLGRVRGTANMLFLRNIDRGELSWSYRNGPAVTVTFPKNLFPTIGIWWNNTGYPGESGLERCECAFEPVSGSSSTLLQAYKEGLCLAVPAESRLGWEVRWEVTR